MRIAAFPIVIASLLAPAALAQAPAGHGNHGAAAAPAPRLAAGAQVLEITAFDYAFTMPDSVSAGLTEVHLLNQGPELHHVQIIRLEEGKRLADLYRAFQAGGPPPAWMREVGGPNAPVPTGTSITALNLEPGRHVVVCFIPSPDGTPHIVKGMMKEFVVTPARTDRRAASAAQPRADVTITLSDYDFALSRPLVQGRQTVRVLNTATQPHEVFFARLAPGKTAADLVAWVEKMEGPPPAMPMGGTTGFIRGEENYVALNLEPGEYALLCFIPDAGDGRPHVAHGMMKQITVPAGGTRASTGR